MTDTKIKLTAIQRQTLKTVTDFYKKYGYPCTQLYVAQKRNVTLPTVHRCINRLILLGFLERPQEGTVIPRIDKQQLD